MILWDVGQREHIMTAIDVAIQIKSLRAQLDVLEAKLRTAPSERGHSLADLKGMLAGQADTTAEEIEQVLYHLPLHNEP
jgi:hypothetical protein